jgi:hypothetical protein
MLEFFTSPVCFSLLEFVAAWIVVQLIADTASLTSNWITNLIYKKKQK